MDFMDYPVRSQRTNLDTMLRRRGHAILKTGEVQRTLFWNAATNKTLLALGQFEYVRFFGRDPLSAYMERFAQSSFRKTVIAIMRAGRTGLEIDQIRKESGRRTDDYLRLLEYLQVITVDGGVVRWFGENDNLGPSLEHYVAALCERELGASAVEWGVMLNDIPTGGEFDVIASLDPNLLYVECKSSLRNITDEELRETLRRNEELTPELCVLLVDTGHALADLSQRLNKVVKQVGMEGLPFSELKIGSGIFFGNAQTYVVNSRPSILRQLRSCLRHYHATVKPAGGYGFDATVFRQGLATRPLPGELGDE